MSEELKQEQTEQQEMPEEEVKQQLPNLLKGIPGAPTQEQIEQWKIKFGEVFVSGFSETELFVWRPMRRMEYAEMQAIIQNPDNGITQFQVEEMVCDTCILFPAGPHNWREGKAGTPQTLSEQIMLNSHFMSPATASMLVVKL